MKRLRILVFSLLFLVSAYTLFAQDGEELLQNRCTQCHTLEVVEHSQKTEKEWLVTIENMVDYGANLTLEEQEVLARYLSERKKIGGKDE